MGNLCLKMQVLTQKQKLESFREPNLIVIFVLASLDESKAKQYRTFSIFAWKNRLLIKKAR